MREIVCNYKLINNENNIYLLKKIEIFEDNVLINNQPLLYKYIKKIWNLRKEDEKLEEQNLSNQNIVYTFIKDFQNIINYMEENKIDKIFTKVENWNLFDDNLTIKDLENINS